MSGFKYIQGRRVLYNTNDLPVITSVQAIKPYALRSSKARHRVYEADLSEAAKDSVPADDILPKELVNDFQEPSEVLPEVQEPITDVLPDVQEPTTDVLPDVVPDVVPDVQEAITEVLPEILPEIQEAETDVLPEILPEVQEPTFDVLPEVLPEILPEILPEVQEPTFDVLPEVDLTTDVLPEVEPTTAVLPECLPPSLEVVLLECPTVMEITFIKSGLNALIAEYHGVPETCLTETGISDRMAFAHKLCQNYSLYACPLADQWLKFYVKSVLPYEHFDTVNMSAGLTVSNVAQPFKMVSLYTGHITNLFKWEFRACGVQWLKITIKEDDQTVILYETAACPEARISLRLTDWCIETVVNDAPVNQWPIPHTEFFSKRKYGELTCTGKVTAYFGLEDKEGEISEPSATESWPEYIGARTGLSFVDV